MSLPDAQVEVSTASSADTALFGSLNATIADHLSSRVDETLAIGVATLPLLQSQPSRAETLHAMLRRCYWKNVDVFEVYCDRNVFTTNMFPIERRTAIAQLYTQAQRENTSADTILQEAFAHTVEEATTSPTDAPRKVESAVPVPSEQDVQDLHKELASLRLRLRDAHRRKLQVTQSIKELDVANQLANLANETLQVRPNPDGSPALGLDQVHQTVTATLVGTERLTTLQGKGLDVIQEMERKTRERGPEEEPEDTVDLMLASGTINRHHKKPKTLTERYAQEQAEMGTHRTAVRAILGDSNNH